MPADKLAACGYEAARVIGQRNPSLSEQSQLAQPGHTSRVALAAFVFALLSVFCGVIAMAGCMAWLLVPYMLCAVLTLGCAMAAWGSRRAGWRNRL